MRGDHGDRTRRSRLYGAINARVTRKSVSSALRDGMNEHSSTPRVSVSNAVFFGVGYVQLKPEARGTKKTRTGLLLVD